MRTLRLLWVGWVMHMKMLTRSAFNFWLGIIYPLFFATAAFFMFQSGDDPKPLLYASLGAAVMGIWGATSTAAGNALSQQRWHGTLELLVTAPAHFALLLLPMTIAMATIGIYSMISTLIWGRLVFGIEVEVGDPIAFALAVPATVVSIGALGFLLAVAFVRFRQAWALGNMLEYPVWLVSGFLVPLTLFPAWVLPISWVLAPTWGVSAIRGAALGGSPYGDIALALLLGAGYTLVGILLLERALRAARAKATLSLVVTGARVFFVGGLISYRALFGWLSPWVFIPSLLVAPVFQILLFVYIGRSAALESDEFFVIGNGLQYAAIPCVFAMTNIDRRRALPADARPDPDHSGAAAAALRRPRPPGRPERLLRRRLRARRRRR